MNSCKFFLEFSWWFSSLLCQWIITFIIFIWFIFLIWWIFFISFLFSVIISFLGRLNIFDSFFNFDLYFIKRIIFLDLSILYKFPHCWIFDFFFLFETITVIIFSETLSHINKPTCTFCIIALFFVFREKLSNDPS